MRISDWSSDVCSSDLSIAYWCVLIAALLPYVWVGIAKSRGQRYNNRDPRGWLARQDNPLVQRANAAQLNAFEAFAPFAARSDERRVGKECVRTCRTGGWPDN